MISGQNLPPRTSGKFFGLSGPADRPDRQKPCPSLHILPPNLCIFEAQNRQIFRTQLGGSFPGPASIHNEGQIHSPITTKHIAHLSSSSSRLQFL